MVFALAVKCPQNMMGFQTLTMAQCAFPLLVPAITEEMISLISLNVLVLKAYMLCYQQDKTHGDSDCGG